ncbi:MAG: lysophospholipid acyltransferase family protein [Mycobacteriaceae bacterium]
MSTGLLDKIEHAWLPKTTCDERCVGGEHPESSARAAIRSVRRIVTVFLVLLALPLLVVPVPGRAGVQRGYCRLVLRCLGVRIRLSGNPIRNLPGVLVVSNHTSWVDVFAIGAVVPGSFVARADLVEWPAIGPAVRMMGVIPIDRRSLRKLPPVVEAVTERLRQGRTVVAFPEGTTFCGRHNGKFRPAVFQASIDSGRPVQPVCLTYRYRDGRQSTVTAFLGEDSLWASVKRTVRAHVTVVDLVVGSLELPGASRRELAARCETALRVPAAR